MISSFKDAFIRKPQFSGQTPKAVLDVLSEDLPDGFRYVNDHDGICKIECDGVINFENLCIRLPESARPLFEKIKVVTINDIRRYSQNTQTNIEMLPDKDGCFTINNEKIRADQIFVAPLKPQIKCESGKFYIMAPPLPKPFPIEVAGNGFSLTIMVQQQLINSATEIKIGTIGDSALDINYVFEPKAKGKLTLNMTTRPSCSATDVLASREIFNAFIDGKGTLCGTLISSNQKNIKDRIPPEVIRLWHDIVELERKMKVEFDARKKLTSKDITRIRELYRCFVEDKPFKVYLNENTVRGIGEFNHDMITVGKEILFEYGENVQVDILGTNIKYYALTSIFGGAVNEIQKPEKGITGEFFIRVCPVNGKRMYAAKKYFKDASSAENFQEEQKHIDKMQAATELQ